MSAANWPSGIDDDHGVALKSLRNNPKILFTANSFQAIARSKLNYSVHVLLYLLRLDSLVLLL
ncbi:hypothetical protein AY600_18610 [Phormidium willei BDU 130791]|nr:hypothetical protein AY600_18610 [Phormidium willei BDU 130791]